MKSYHLSTTLFVLATVLIFSSCKDFVSQPAKGALSEEVLANKKGIQTSLTGAYAALDGQNLGGGPPWANSPDNWIYGSVAAGMAHKGSNAGDQVIINSIAKNTFSPTNSFFDSKWKAGYEAISRTNAVLKLLGKTDDFSEEEKNSIAAEARFLRGHFYFDLKKMFNNIPWIDETVTDYTTVPNTEDIWPRIEEDFQFAMNNLPETQSKVGRANSWAAASYLAKTYVYQQKWQQAKPLFDDIIANGMTSNGLPYELVDQFKDNFDAGTENNSESIFAIQMVAEDGTGTARNSNMGGMLNYPVNSPFRCCGFFIPTQDLVNSYRTTSADGLPMPSTYNNDEVKNDYNIDSDESFTTHQGPLDPRLDWTVGRRGIPYLDWGPHPGNMWFRDQSYSGPYSPQKNIYWQATQDEYANNVSWAPGTAINYPIIRFADLLLLAAETEVELGNLEQARRYVNRVRERAGNSDGWVNNDYNKPFALDVVDTESAMLNSGAKPGDWVVRTDRNSTFVLLEGAANERGNWQEYVEPNYNIEQYPGPWTDKNLARQRVRFERKLELAMEGHRYFDLVRWGEAEEKLNALYQYEGNLFNNVFTGGQFKHAYYPIPQRQIDLTNAGGETVLQQNEGY